MSGKEHAEISKILLGLIIGLPLPDNRSSNKLLRAVKGILDFTYLTQLPSHTDETLADMSAALDTFHINKSIFIELQIRDNFDFPKLHSLLHYAPSIQLFGTTDNYNTEHTERLHIDLAKNAYAATNHKDELSQMIIWLERKDKITRFDDVVQWRLDDRPPPLNEVPPNIHRTRIQIARNPTASMTFDDVCNKYGTRDFSKALSKFLVRHMNPLASQAELAYEVSHFNPGFGRVPVFQKVKIWIKDLQGRAEADDTLDVIHARQESKAKSGRKLSARFDTALVDTASSDGLSEPGELLCHASACGVLTLI